MDDQGGAAEREALAPGAGLLAIQRQVIRKLVDHGVDEGRIGHRTTGHQHRRQIRDDAVLGVAEGPTIDGPPEAADQVGTGAIIPAVVGAPAEDRQGLAAFVESLVIGHRQLLLDDLGMGRRTTATGVAAGGTRTPGTTATGHRHCGCIGSDDGRGGSGNADGVHRIARRNAVGCGRLRHGGGPRGIDLLLTGMVPLRARPIDPTRHALKT